MALRMAWWMSPDTKTGTNAPDSSFTVQDPRQPAHKSWPGDKAPSGLTFGELEKLLNGNKSQHCHVQKLTYGPELSAQQQQPLWKQTADVRSISDLVVLLQNPDLDATCSTFYILRNASGEAVQALGHYLNITPRFFNFGFTTLSMGNTVDSYAFFGIQVIEKYLPTAVTTKMRAQPVPYAKFGNHEWHVTMVAALFMREGDQYRGIIHLQSNDDAIADGIKRLITRDEETFSDEGEKKAGQSQILAEIMYIVRFQWDAFLSEAEAHLQDLSRQTIEGDLSSTQQLRYMRDLHRLLPMWTAARRRITAAKDLNKSMSSHPYFVKNEMHESMSHYLGKCNQVLDECMYRCDALTTQTENIINLIFNIATLQDTRASVEQSIAANTSAASIRRVTLLTFIYLPLMLVAAIYGMNVREISHVAGELSIWSYFVASGVVFVVNLGAWLVWSRFAVRSHNDK